MEQSFAQFAVTPDSVLIHEGVLTVVIREEESGAGKSGNRKPSTQQRQGAAAVPRGGRLQCFRSVSDSSLTEFLRAWKQDGEKQDFKTEIRHDEGADMSSSDLEAEIRIMNSKGKVLSACTVKKASADEVLPAFVEERAQDRKTIQELQALLKKLTIEKNLMEDSMYRAFAKCLNAKKEKIRELQDQEGPGRRGASRSTGQLKTSNTKAQSKGPVRKSKRTLKNFNSQSDTDDSDSEEESHPEHVGQVVTKTKPKTAKDMYDDDTDTDADEPVAGHSSKTKTTKSANANPMVIGSSSDAETDYDGDEVVLNMKEPKTEDKNNIGKGPSPAKLAKVDSDSDPMAKFDKDLLLDGL